MIYIQSFKNYDEFQKLFSVVEHGNGVKSRKNKILLGCLKDRRFIHWWLQFRDEYAKRTVEEDKSLDILQCTNMMQLKSFVKEIIHRYASLDTYWNRADFHEHKSILAGSWIMYSSRMQANQDGLCADGDTKSVRYINLDTNRIYKMKAGKFITKCIEEQHATSIMPEQAKRWIGEEFARDWEAYAEEKIGNADNLTLCVGSSTSDFEDIYNGELCEGDFGSCMEDNDQFYFYTNSVDASAAYLRNADGNIVARCVIFNDVHDDEGNSYRLAERQYTTDEQEVLKQILVNKLIEAGRIDGYKKVGVDCHDNRNFISVSGESLRDKKFRIHCNLDDDDTLSYQDSFKYYNFNTKTAYNYPEEGYTDELDETDDTFKRSHKGEEWSEIEQEYIPCDQAEWDEYNGSYVSVEYSSDAIFHGRTIRLSDYRTNDFCWSDHENCYIYEDECYYVESHDDYYLDNDVVEDIHGDNQLAEECVWSNYECAYIPENEASYSKVYEDFLFKKTASYSKLLDDVFYDGEDKDMAEETYRKEHALMCIA